mmetsp:Transcript_30511/g.97345  ORF Transcript_30511/g.97345 Transcript_30511/m.97345 type:complete len:244 (-) Transcript_30511:1743-2474(-)
MSDTTLATLSPEGRRWRDDRRPRSSVSSSSADSTSVCGVDVPAAASFVAATFSRSSEMMLMMSSLDMSSGGSSLMSGVLLPGETRRTFGGARATFRAPPFGDGTVSDCRDEDFHSLPVGDPEPKPKREDRLPTRVMPFFSSPSSTPSSTAAVSIAATVGGPSAWGGIGPHSSGASSAAGSTGSSSVSASSSSSSSTCSSAGASRCSAADASCSPTPSSSSSSAGAGRAGTPRWASREEDPVRE